MSPDGAYRLVLFENRLTTVAMPGQSGDAGGTVRLFDSRGNMLGEAKLEMLQHINNVRWYDDRVVLPLVFDWKLNGQKN